MPPEKPSRHWNNPFSHGMRRLGVATPVVKLANPIANSESIIRLAERAHQSHISLLVFPELCLSGYSNEDLFFQSTLLSSVNAAVIELKQHSKKHNVTLVVGAPLAQQGRLFNCAVVISRGEILGVVPKTYLPNYGEFYEPRQFHPGANLANETIRIQTDEVPFGTDLLFECSDDPYFCFGVEICEDLWSPVPPSSFQAMHGATVLVNLSASNILIGKAKQRQSLCEVHSRKCLAAYLFSSAGSGESTTDLSWDGQAHIYENGLLLASGERFSDNEQLIVADVDVEGLVLRRLKQGSFHACEHEWKSQSPGIRRIRFSCNQTTQEMGLIRPLERYVYVPSNREELDQHCFEAYSIQVSGLAQRLKASGIKRIVLGISGGLDSTQALLVACQCFDQLGYPRKDILCYTLPGPATSAHTLKTAEELMRVFAVSAKSIDITPQCEQMFKDIEHPFAMGQKRYDITFENVQAGVRTSLLFRLANLNNALVLGTGDLSELALGWSTYGVGDHMSHYNVNASVPKTFIQHLIRWVNQSSHFEDDVQKVVQRVLETEISPELIPSKEEKGGNHTNIQRTEDFIGPYSLQDFNLYHMMHMGFSPSKTAYLAYQAWHNTETGTWPPNFPDREKKSYTMNEIIRWLEVFLVRFFEQSQFKRSAVPNGPKLVGSSALSPRGDWRAPSDIKAEMWIENLANFKRDVECASNTSN